MARQLLNRDGSPMRKYHSPLIEELLNEQENNMQIKYKCKDNDVELKFITEDNEIDEVWVRVIGEKGWTVIGYSDLNNGIKKTLSKIQGGNK